MSGYRRYRQEERQKKILWALVLLMASVIGALAVNVAFLKERATTAESNLDAYVRLVEGATTTSEQSE